MVSIQSIKADILTGNTITAGMAVAAYINPHMSSLQTQTVAELVKIMELYQKDADANDKRMADMQTTINKEWEKQMSHPASLTEGLMG